MRSIAPDDPRLFDLLAGRRVVALTGAGCSTASGIPDYRGATSQVRPRRPIQYREFVDDEATRTRYWARATIGWPRMRGARPNAAHFGLAQLETAGVVAGTITQNVDRLHHAGGSTRVVELHGALHRVRCMACGALEDRDAVQQRLLAENPSFVTDVVATAPDGDADLPLAASDGFVVVDCLMCGGMLKPDVVFFGETVPRPVLDDARALLGAGQALLVLGSSLAVFSGYRFVRYAADAGLPIVVVNQGPTRGDPYAALCVQADVTEVVPWLSRCLPPA